MDTKDAVIGIALTAAYACVSWAFMEIIDINEKQAQQERELLYLQKEVDMCVKRDLFEVEKMLLIERLKK